MRSDKYVGAASQPLTVTLADVIHNKRRTPVLFEVIPPSDRAAPEKVRSHARRVAASIAPSGVDAVNLPDVRAEQGNGTHSAQATRKMAPDRYAHVLASELPSSCDIVLNRPTVAEPAAALQAWVAQAVTRGWTNLVLVGGESSGQSYPGPGPCEAARLLGPRPDLLLGGIAIPGRRRVGPTDEPLRLLEKIKAGMRFFTTQVLFEPNAMVQLVEDYSGAADSAAVEPAPLLVSFAPITQPKDVGFLRWLGVEIPTATAKKVLAVPPKRRVEASIEVASGVLEQVRDAAAGSGVKIGINVEHVMRYNLEPAAHMLAALTTRRQTV